MFIDVLNGLIKEKGITRTQFLEDLKIGKNTPYYWKIGGGLPNSSTLSAIANYFGVTTDYLLEKEPEQQKKPTVSDNDELNDTVDDLLTRVAVGLFTGLPISDKRLAIDLIQRLYGDKSNNK